MSLEKNARKISVISRSIISYKGNVDCQTSNRHYSVHSSHSNYFWQFVINTSWK